MSRSRPIRWSERETNHPADIADLATRNDNQQTGQTKNEGKQDERKSRRRLRRDDSDDDDVDGEGDSGGQDKRADKLDEDNKLATGGREAGWLDVNKKLDSRCKEERAEEDRPKAKGAPEVTDHDEDREVVNGRIDPPSALREEHAERVRDDRLANGLRTEEHLALRERLEKERRQVTVFAEQQQILCRRERGRQRSANHKQGVSASGRAHSYEGCQRRSQSSPR